MHRWESLLLIGMLSTLYLLKRYVPPPSLTCMVYRNFFKCEFWFILYSEKRWFRIRGYGAFEIKWSVLGTGHIGPIGKTRCCWCWWSYFLDNDMPTRVRFQSCLSFVLLLILQALHHYLSCLNLHNFLQYHSCKLSLHLSMLYDAINCCNMS